MSRCVKLFAMAIAMAGLVTVGCESEKSEQPVANWGSAPEPVAIVACAPSPAAFAKALTIAGIKNEDDDSLDADQLSTQFPGMDTSRSAATFLYLSDKGVIEPLIYIPVKNYQEFETGLDKLFRMQRAIATKFRFGKYQLVMMDLGEYAAISTSRNIIKDGPESPQPFIGQQFDAFDFVLNWHPGRLLEDQEKMLEMSLRRTLSGSVAKLALQSDSLTCYLKSDSPDQLEIRGQVTANSDDTDQTLDLVNDLVNQQGWNTTSKNGGGQITFTTTVPTSDASATWKENIQPAITRFFKSQYKLLAKKGSSPKTKLVYESDALGELARSIVPADAIDCSPGGGSGGGASRG